MFCNFLSCGMKKNHVIKGEKQTLATMHHITQTTTATTMLLLAVVLMVPWQITEGVENLLLNPSFEDTPAGTWNTKGFRAEQYADDKLDGRYSLRCSERKKKLVGPSQYTTGLRMGSGYELRAYVKLLNDNPDKLWQQLKAVVRFDFTVKVEGNTLRPISGIETAQGAYIIAWRAFVRSEQGWVLLTGNINAPMLPFSGAELAIRGPDEGIDFLLDNVTLYEIPERSDWLTASHAMIDEHRKSDINLRVTVPAGVNPADVDVQLELKNHLFGFGSKVEDKLLYRKKTQHFRDMFFNLFNWATIGSFKWRFDKSRDLYSPDFSNAEEALDVLNEHGIKVRAHSIVWGVQKNIPDKVVATPPEELPRLLKFHTEYMVNLTRGKVEHWDVQNEFLHGHWYEETMKDPHVSENIFKMARPLDPKVKLYLNDFTAVNSGANTEDFHDMGVRFIKANTGIQGLGVQGHVKEFIKPTSTMIWRRLDRLAETGLEIFLTEFDIGWRDDVVRADWFEDAMRAYFAHPGLSGVILWGFWKDWQTYQDKYLVYGKDMKFAEQGQRFVCLTQKEWTTRKTFNLRDPIPPSVRGFRGDYEVIIRKRGIPVQRETFTLGKETTVVDIRVTDSNVPIAVQDKHDYVPQCISHRDQKSVGTVNSSLSQSAEFTCSDRMSPTSGSFNGAEVSVTCEAGEIMTSCSSFHAGHSSGTRRGERITVEDGVVTCTAIKGTGSPEGVRASARCCRASELKCDYRQAGPSSPMDGAMAESTCPPGHMPLGCSIFNQYSVLEGAFPNQDMTSCLAQSGPPLSEDPALKSGAVSYAACCSKPGLQCRQVASSQQPIRGVINVTCPLGDVMTGCNVMGEEGGLAGAHIDTDQSSGVSHCRAFVGNDLPDGEAKVSAVAICCNSSSS
ncbi:uncharacterized protein [Littorina saxatilis]